MDKRPLESCEKDIIDIGGLLWQKNLATGLNGNISVRADNDTLLMTGHKTCLGRLKESDLVLIDSTGNVKKGGKATSESLLHTEIYKNFPDCSAIIHTHATYTNGFFISNKILVPSIFETKLYLGEIHAIDQFTPTVTDVAPVVSELKNNSIVVLRNHGTLVIGKDLFDCFLLVQTLEEAVKIDLISSHYKLSNGNSAAQESNLDSTTCEKKYELFSKEQIDEIVRLVNDDKQLGEMGKKTSMTMSLGVKLNETGQIYSFCFKDGRIEDVRNDENAEFLISAPKNIWKAVFNREIDPFVATTQKKMDLRGDFARISKWYAPCSRIFELWTKVPVK